MNGQGACKTSTTASEPEHNVPIFNGLDVLLDFVKMVFSLSASPGRKCSSKILVYSAKLDSVKTIGSELKSGAPAAGPVQSVVKKLASNKSCATGSWWSSWESSWSCGLARKELATARAYSTSKYRCSKAFCPSLVDSNNSHHSISSRTYINSPSSQSSQV